MIRTTTTALAVRVVVACLLVGAGQTHFGQGVATAQPVPSSATAMTTAALAAPARSRPLSSIRVIPGTKLVVNVNPNLPPKRSWRVRIERLDGGTWQKVCTCRTKGRWERIVLAQPPGQYRVKVLPRKGYRTPQARTTFTFTPATPEATTAAAETSSASPPMAQVAAFTGSPLWSADYETGDLSQFAVTSWNNAPLAPQVSTTAQSGRFAGQYTIPGGGMRSENVPSAGIKFREGDDLWFGVSTWLDADVPLNTGEWQQLTQWKNDGEGSPPLGLTLENGRYEIGGGWGWPGTNTPTSPKLAKVSLGTATAGVWENWLIHIRFSSDPTKGSVDVWRNGTQVVAGWHPPGGTLYPNLESYWKMGYYRSTNITQQSTIRLDNLRLGTTRTSIGA